MRDDISGLGALRMFPEASMSIASATPMLPQSLLPQSLLPRFNTTGLTTSFASELARATQARTALTSTLTNTTTNTSLTANAARTAPRPPLKPYVSPLRQYGRYPQASQTIQKPTSTLPKASTSSSTSTSWPGSTTRTSATSTSNLSPTRPLAPVQKPQTTQPTLPLNPNLPLPLDAYPRPNGDNGRGMHWIPTTDQSTSAIDRFVAEAHKMGVKWVTFLNNGADVGKNDYLVSKLVGAGIEPIMRLYTPTLQPISGDVEGMVRHYVSMGVHYFQPYNEPNLNSEQPDGSVSVDRYLDNWIPAAQAILRGGGLPGFGSMAPGGDMDDQQFLMAALDGLRQRGQLGMLDKAWLSMHNYTHNHPIEEPYVDGFFKFRNYHQILSNALGRDLPIIGTEGGTFVGEQEDTSMPAADAQTVASWATQAYTYMRDRREPWNFAYSFWTIANAAGGGSDTRFDAESLFRADGSQSLVVKALQSMTTG